MAELFPEGKYKARVSELGYDESKEKKTPEMRVSLDICNEDGTSSGHTRYAHLWLTDGSIVYTNKKLAEIGFDGNFDQPVWDKEKLVTVVCKHEDGVGKYEGKPNEKWDIYTPREAKEVPGDLKRSLAAKYKAQVGNVVPKPTTPPPPLKPSLPKAAKLPDETMETVWEAVCSKADSEKMGDDIVQKLWDDTIVNVATSRGRQPEAFTSDDWRSVKTNIIATFDGMP